MGFEVAQAHLKLWGKGRRYFGTLAKHHDAGCHLRHIQSTSGGGSGSRSRRWVPRSPCFSQCLGEASALPQSLRSFQAPTSLFQSKILQATSVLSAFVRKGMGKVKGCSSSNKDRSRCKTLNTQELLTG